MHLQVLLLTHTWRRSRTHHPRKEAETWPPELQPCSCWLSSASSLQQVSRKVHFNSWMDGEQVCVYALPAASNTFCSAFVFLQLKLCWTAARAKHPRSSRFRESIATAFRMLGAAVTSARLCKAQTFIPSIHQSKVPVVAENETAGNFFASLLILCFSSVSPAL